MPYLVDPSVLVREYQQGSSLPQLAEAFGISRSTARYHVKRSGALRSRTEGVQLAAIDGRLGTGSLGKSRTFTEKHKAAISIARKKWSAANAVGTSVKPNGYREITMGEHKGRLEHDVVMERRLGRRLLDDEHVHHIDGDKLNNEENNLALVTRSGHARLHRREERLMGKKGK